jgi:hypothetical protein
MKSHTLAAAALILASSCFAQSPQTILPNDPEASAYLRDIELLRNAGNNPRAGLDHTTDEHALNRIADELAALDRNTLPDTDWAKEWAGIYRSGGWGGATIYVAPKAGIATFSSYCEGDEAGKCADIVEALPDGLKLKLADDPLREYHTYNYYISQRMYFVKWAGRHFLLSDSNIIAFVNEYNQGGGSRETMSGIPELDRSDKYVVWPNPTKTRGKPELPPQYAKLLREAPITLKVTSVAPLKIATGIRAGAYEIQFEGGQDQGAYVGLEFSGAAWGVIELTKVDAKTSQGTVTTWSPDQDIKLPQVGGVLANTTSLFDSPEAPDDKKVERTKESPSPK